MGRKRKGKKRSKVKSSLDTLEKNVASHNDVVCTASECECGVSVYHTTNPMMTPRGNVHPSDDSPSLLDLTVTYDYTTGDVNQTKDEPESSMQQLAELFTFKDSPCEVSHSCSSLWKDMQSHPPPSKKSRLSSLTHASPFRRLCNMASQLEKKFQSISQDVESNSISKRAPNCFSCYHNNTNPDKLSLDCHLRLDRQLCNHDNKQLSTNPGDDISDSEDDAIFWTQVVTQFNESPAGDKVKIDDSQVNEGPIDDSQVNESPIDDNQVNESQTDEDKVYESPTHENRVNESPTDNNQANESPTDNRKDPSILSVIDCHVNRSSDDEFIDQLLMCCEQPTTHDTCHLQSAPKNELSPFNCATCSADINDERTLQAKSLKRWYSCMEIERKRQLARLKLAKKNQLHCTS